MDTSHKLKIAIHKSDLLHKKSVQMLKDSGMVFDTFKDSLRVNIPLSDIDLYSFRQEDIPNLVSEGVIDVGIVGQEIFAEAGRNVSLLDLKLGISKCKLSILVPIQSDYRSITDLDGKRIATSFPTILKKKLMDNFTNAEVFDMSQDTVKLSSFIGIAEAIFDEVTDESKLLSNGMREIAFASDEFDSIIIYDPNISQQKKAILDTLRLKIKAVLDANVNKYVLLNVRQEELQAVVAVLPSMESPTILRLSDPNWFAIHTVINETELWEKMQDFTRLGAENIVVLPIEKLIL